MGEEIAKQNEYEEIQQTLTDFSGLPYFDRVVPLVREPILKGKAIKMVVFPDLGETEKGVVPTGSVTQFDTKITPEYLSFVKGADIGCGMLVAAFEGTSADSVSGDKSELQNQVDEITRRIIASKEATTGSGNHFVDWVSIGDEKTFGVVIHTGAPRNQQNDLSRMVEKWAQKDAWSDANYATYRAEYNKVFDASHNNRMQLLQIMENMYGKPTIMSHKAHNVIVWDDPNERVTIYKGAVRVTDNNERLLLPSHMQGDMYFYTPGPAVGEQSMWGAPHGTGRRIPMSAMKEDFVVAPLNIVTPSHSLINGVDAVSKKQYPEAYRDISEVAKIMEANKLMPELDIDNTTIMKPFAYVGHLKNKGQA